MILFSLWLFIIIHFLCLFSLLPSPILSNHSLQIGHCLGDPNCRSVIPSQERSLSPAACNILRAVMHSALIWASCNSDAATEGLLQLVKPAVQPHALPEFFWDHLERDLQLVGVALGKNVEEAAIVVHLVIKHILTSGPTRSEMKGCILCVHLLTSIISLLPPFLLPHFLPISPYLSLPPSLLLSIAPSSFTVIYR